MLTRVLPSVAVICAALLWSVDGVLRQNLHSISSLVIVLIEWLVDSGNYELSLKILIGSLMIGILSLVYLVDDPGKEKLM